MGSTYFFGVAVSCEIEYHAFCERLGPLITLQRFISMKNPSWSKEEVTYWTSIAEGGRARATRWKEAQGNPTPIRSTQLCYSCKVPWEPDHRCRGKGKKHIIEVHYDSDDEDSEKSDDDNDSCTKASDTEAMDACMLEEDDDPCVAYRQLD
jgi:hypothetical protein